MPLPLRRDWLPLPLRRDWLPLPLFRDWLPLPLRRDRSPRLASCVSFFCSSRCCPRSLFPPRRCPSRLPSRIVRASTARVMILNRMSFLFLRSCVCSRYGSSNGWSEVHPLCGWNPGATELSHGCPSLRGSLSGESRGEPVLLEERATQRRDFGGLRGASAQLSAELFLDVFEFRDLAIEQLDQVVADARGHRQ